MNQGDPEKHSVSEAEAPSLEILVSKIPDSSRDLLDELFRGKFIGVRKIDPSKLK